MRIVNARLLRGKKQLKFRVRGVPGLAGARYEWIEALSLKFAGLTVFPRGAQNEHATIKRLHLAQDRRGGS